MHSARIAFVEGRDRLAHKDRAHYGKKKKHFYLGKLMRRMLRKLIPNDDSVEGLGARVAYQVYVQGQGRARTQNSKGELLKAGKSSTSQDPQKKKKRKPLTSQDLHKKHQVGDWLDTLQNCVEQEDDARSCQSDGSLTRVDSYPSFTGTA